MPFLFPSFWRESECYLVPIHAALIPFVAGALRTLEAREMWATDGDHEAAYNAIAELEATMLQTCASELIESNRQIYRLLNKALYGQEYIVADQDPLTIYPEIPLVPNSDPELPGIVPRFQKMERLLDNAINGIEYPEYQSSTSMRVELVRIREILEEGGGELHEEMLAELVKIAALLV